MRPLKQVGEQYILYSSIQLFIQGAKMVLWTRESIRELEVSQIEILKSNAAKMGNQEVVALCDEELVVRKPNRSKQSVRLASETRTGYYVAEYHFVCPKELGISNNPDGTFWTGTWVVSQKNANASVNQSSNIFLHISKSESSYLQGILRNWRTSERLQRYNNENLTQTKLGIDFLVEPTSESILWSGDGSGEKGYKWLPLPK